MEKIFMVTHSGRTGFFIVLVITCCAVILSGACPPSPTATPSSGTDILNKAQQNMPRTAKFVLQFSSTTDQGNSIKVQGEGSFATVSTSAGVYQNYPTFFDGKTIQVENLATKSGYYVRLGGDQQRWQRTSSNSPSVDMSDILNYRHLQNVSLVGLEEKDGFQTYHLAAMIPLNSYVGKLRVRQTQPVMEKVLQNEGGTPQHQQDM